MKRHTLLPLLLCIIMTATLLTGCSTSYRGSQNGSTATPPVSDLSGRGAVMADSYAEIFKALSSASSDTGNAPMFGFGAREESVADGASVPPIPPVDSSSIETAGAQNSDYSQTNVQVSGIDEGDIVKTDGSFIYVLRQNELIIFKADGVGTVRVGAVKVGHTAITTPTPGYNGQTPEDTTYYNEYASDIYVTGNTAVIVTSHSSYGPYYMEDAVVRDESMMDIDTGVAIKPAILPINNQQVAKLYIFDIADKAHPLLKAELGQDGYVLTTRLLDKTLYMLSTYHVYNSDENNNESFIPKLYHNGQAKLMNPGDIAIMPYFNSTSYTVIGTYNLDSATLDKSQSILGGGSTVYMNQTSLYIANSTADQSESAPYTDSVYTVIDYAMTNVTDITRFDIGGGTLTLAATGSVPGNLNSQFALDEFEGNLRVVTTTYSQSWSEFTDKDKGFVNYVYKEPSSDNALYVVDAGLHTIGSVTNLAEGEQVYSVRFDGEIGYFVTFRQVDPLFAVDLSDPTKPAVLSALKIPGFSEYLHIYGPGRLFGLGMDADEETGRTNGMKLTMFDTTDPANVTEKHTKKLDSGYSIALYNHKAILLSPDKNLIAFPVDNGYDIYGYSDEQGFYKRAAISSVEWSGDSRGLYIGDYGYIIDNSAISVLDMMSFKLLNKISY